LIIEHAEELKTFTVENNVGYLLYAAPGGELLMVRTMPDHDNVMRLEYTSRFTGE